jgi:hypothetical protein
MQRWEMPAIIALLVCAIVLVVMNQTNSWSYAFLTGKCAQDPPAKVCQNHPRRLVGGTFLVR